MKVAHGVEMLELEMNMMGRSSTICPTLLYDDKHAVLVDVGMPGQLQSLKAAFERAGVAFERIDGVILTHQDIDHVGGIEEVLHALDHQVNVYAHAEDKPYIEGDKEPIKMNRERVSQMLSSLPEEMRKQAEAIFSNPPRAKVTNAVADGDVLPMFGGVQVVFTPGHTPGHISLYHRPSKTLIAGDATVSQDGKLLGLNAHATPDMPRATESLKQFTNLDVENVICYHGGFCHENVNEQFRELVK